MPLHIKDIVNHCLSYEKVQEIRCFKGVKCLIVGFLAINVMATTIVVSIVINAKVVQSTMMIFQSHHQPLKVWIIRLYLTSLNLLNAQIGKELGLSANDIHAMTSVLRKGVYEKRTQEQWEGEVEFDESYLIAGHKGKPSSVKKGRKGQLALGALINLIVATSNHNQALKYTFTLRQIMLKIDYCALLKLKSHLIISF